jgi:hypothetical protein
VCPCLQAGDNCAGGSEFSADESHVIGKQIHHFEVVLVIRLLDETSSGRVDLDITKEYLAGTDSMSNRGFTAIGRARSPDLVVDAK